MGRGLLGASEVTFSTAVVVRPGPDTEEEVLREKGKGPVAYSNVDGDQHRHRLRKSPETTGKLSKDKENVG
jgi:hypothetical protein